MILGGINQRIELTTVCVANDTVSLERRNLFGTRNFEEPLNAYLCVLPLSSIVTSRGEMDGIAYYAKLVHGMDPSRDITLLVYSVSQLGMLAGPGNERKPYEDFARGMDLPLAAMGADGSATLRSPEELDLPLSERGPGSGPEPSGPERPFPSRKYRIEVRPDGFTAVRGYPVYWIPFAGFVAGAAAAGLFLKDTGARLGLPLTLGVFTLFMLAFSLTRARLTLTGDAVESVHTIAGFSVQNRGAPWPRSRRSAPLTLPPAAVRIYGMRRVLAIDMGGTKTAAGVVDEAGNILARRIIPTPRESPRAVVEAMKTLSRDVLAETGPVESAGLALPGVVDRISGTLLRSASSGWTDVPFAALVSKALDLPVAAGNDVDACALAEARFGGGAGLDCFFWMTISTGIGGAVYSGGRIAGGPLSGEIGHLVVNPGGATCGCGNRGCLEAEAAGPAWRRRAIRLLDAGGASGAGCLARLPREEVDARSVAEGARTGDPLCLKVVEECARPLAAGIAAVFNLLDPRAVFIGGGVAGAFDILAPVLRRELPALVLSGRERPLRIAESALGYDAALVGAAVLALFPYPP